MQRAQKATRERNIFINSTKSTAEKLFPAFLSQDFFSASFSLASKIPNCLELKFFNYFSESYLAHSREKCTATRKNTVRCNSASFSSLKLAREQWFFVCRLLIAFIHVSRLDLKGNHLLFISPMAAPLQKERKFRPTYFCCVCNQDAN